jgi:hypothetical protein
LILGEVGTPGSYQYRSGLTVITAIAGSYTARADRSGVTIGRGDCGFATQADTFVNPGDINHHCRAVSADRSSAPARNLTDSEPLHELRHAWLTQISRADRGIG